MTEAFRKTTHPEGGREQRRTHLHEIERPGRLVRRSDVRVDHDRLDDHDVECGELPVDDVSVHRAFSRCNMREFPHRTGGGTHARSAGLMPGAAGQASTSTRSDGPAGATTRSFFVLKACTKPAIEASNSTNAAAKLTHAACWARSPKMLNP